MHNFIFIYSVVENCKQTMRRVNLLSSRLVRVYAAAVSNRRTWVTAPRGEDNALVPPAARRTTTLINNILVPVSTERFATRVRPVEKNEIN